MDADKISGTGINKNFFSTDIKITTDFYRDTKQEKNTSHNYFSRIFQCLIWSERARRRKSESGLSKKPL